jgi:hypothetical protein
LCLVRTRVFIGLLVFSHWIIDFITQPMGAAFPGAGFRMRVFFGESPTIEGLGLYNSALWMYVGDYGTLAAGVVIYVMLPSGNVFKGRFTKDTKGTKGHAGRAGV